MTTVVLEHLQHANSAGPDLTVGPDGSISTSNKLGVSNTNFTSMQGEALLQIGDETALWQYNDTNAHLRLGLYYDNGYKFISNNAANWIHLTPTATRFRTSVNTPVADGATGESMTFVVNHATNCIELKAQTISTLDPSAPAGSIAYVTDDNGNLYYKNANSWKSFTAPLGTQSNPAPNAQAIIDA